MTAAVRSGAAALISVLSEDLLAAPGPATLAATAAAAADPTNRQWHLIDLAQAALLAGEPRRALRVLDEVAAGPVDAVLERHLAALRSWATQLDTNCYPGGLGSEIPSLAAPIQPGGGSAETEIIERIVATGPPALLTPRAVLVGLRRQGKSAAVGQMASQAVSILSTLVDYSTATGLDHLRLWAQLAQIDITYRAGATQIAREGLAELRLLASNAGLTGILLLSHLTEGDWAATPDTSPESLGFDLAPHTGPPPILSDGDLDSAATCFQEAERLATAGEAATEAPALWAGIHLRWATLAWLRGDHPSRRRHLDVALTAAQTAGSTSVVKLLEVHLLIADLAEGRLGESLTEIGTGWSQPNPAGRLGSIRPWALTDGSTSWCVGLGRLLERAADRWRSVGEAERAALAYVAAAHLLAAEPRIAAVTVQTAVSDLDSQRNLASRALIRLERLLTAQPPITELPLQMFDFSQALEILVAIVKAQQPRQRGAAAEHAARGLERIRGRLGQLLEVAAAAGITPRALGSYAANMADLRGLVDADKDADLDSLIASNGYDRAIAAMLAMMVASVQEQLVMINVLVPLSRAGHLERLGMTDRADQYYEVALRAAENGQPHLRPLVLIGSGRRAEARQAIAELSSRRVLDDDLLTLLAVQAGDLRVAREALQRIGVDPMASADWKVCLNAAEITIGEPAVSLAAAVRGITLYEGAISRLIRDTDRIEAGDDPSAAALYLTATKACLALAELEPAARADHHALAFEFTERARSLAIDQLLPAVDQQPTIASGPEHRWRELAAIWAADVDRLLVGIDAADPIDTRPLLDRADAAERALRAEEIEQEQRSPGILLRRSRPRAPLRLRAVQDRLLPDAALLEYHTVGDDLIVAAVTADGLSIHRIEVRSRQLAAIVRRHHDSCAAGYGAGPDADQLTALLLDPVADVVGDHRRLIVVPFGPLTVVPVHALPFRGAPLGLDHVLSYAPAAAVGAAPDRLVDLGRSAVVGDPAFDQAVHPRLRRLPGARAEAAVVAATLGTSDVLTGDAATEGAVRALLADRSVLHLACHGWLDQLAPYASSLVLAGKDELTVAEVVGMQLGSDLAVLSACDTGRGAATLGGDVVGLTRALMASGVRGSVVSLWPVDDLTACVTMAAFYRQLSSQPPAAALAAAQREIYGLDAVGLRSRYLDLVGPTEPESLDPVIPRRRRGELDDDEPMPGELGGSAESHWATFVLVGAS